MTSSDLLPEKKYRPCVGICLINSDKKVFVGERIDTPGAWQMPQGGIDEGESILEAAIRELQEETGLTPDSVECLRVADKQITYDLPDALRTTLWKGKYHGQIQNWVAFLLNGDESLINLTAFNQPEFSRYQWVSLQNTADLIVPFKRDTYKQVISLFEDLVS